MSPPSQPSVDHSQPGHSKNVSKNSMTSEATHATANVAGESPENGGHAQPSHATTGDLLNSSAPNSRGDDLIHLGDEPHESSSPTAPKSLPFDTSVEPAVDANEASDGTEALTSSMATLRPLTSPTAPVSQHLGIEPTKYVDPTPPTPLGSGPPSRTPSTAAPAFRHRGESAEPSPTRSEAVYDEKRYASEDEQEQGSRSEIQSIMEQFSEDGGGPGEEEVMSPRFEITSPIFGSHIPVQHPPRQSSLEPLSPVVSQHLQDLQGLRLSSSSPSSILSKEKSQDRPPVPPKDGSSIYSGKSGRGVDDRRGSIESPLSPTMSLHRPPPPDPEPEPPLAFDFHRFLEQLRHKKADPVARYLKSFLSEFSKKQWMVHEQVKIISDFLTFISAKMEQCDVWRDVSDAEFDNAREGMEKLVMNRLYTQTFSPAIPSPQPIPGAKPRKRGAERPMGPGRRGQHQEDVERDEILAQKINIYGWTKEEHLDIPPVNESGKKFLKLAQQELLKIKSYRAPRDKIICVLNCCKVIFGLLKHSKSDSSADSFMPMLIYVVLHANPEHLVSNVQYILRFRNQDKLGGEAGYYLSSLMGAIQFIENMDRTTLTISDDEFEAHVEAAVSAIAEKHRLESPTSPRQDQLLSALQAAEQGASSASTSARPSMDTDAAARPSSRAGTSGPSSEGGDFGDEKAAIAGLLRSIQRPLNSIGRMFSDDVAPVAGTAQHPQAGPSGSGTGSGMASPVQHNASPLPRPDKGGGGGEDPARPRSSKQTLSAEEAAARQASAEAAEAQRLSRAEHANVVETLAGMFPDLDREIISDVVYQKEGRVGLAVDACLALSS